MAGDKKNDYKNSKRQKMRKLQHNNVANGGITPKIQKVIHEYFENGFNQFEAMKSAGYSATTCKQGTHKIFGRPDVKQEIERIQQENHRKFDLNEEWVIRRLMILANGSTGQIMRKLRVNNYDLDALDDEELYFLNEFVEETEYDYKVKNGQKLSQKIPIGAKLKVKGTDRLAALQMLSRKLGLFQDKLEVWGMGSIVERLQAGRNRVAAKGKEDK